MQVPSGAPTSRTDDDRAAVDANLRARCRMPRARVRSTKCETDAMLGSASPRNPSVLIAAEVVRAGDLARRVPLDRQPRVLRLHPLAVVFDANQLLAAELDRDRDAASRRRRARSRPAP